jgi:hypothetical protein
MDTFDWYIIRMITSAEYLSEIRLSDGSDNEDPSMLSEVQHTVLGQYLARNHGRHLKCLSVLSGLPGMDIATLQDLFEQCKQIESLALMIEDQFMVRLNSHMHRSQLSILPQDQILQLLPSLTHLHSLRLWVFMIDDVEDNIREVAVKVFDTGPPKLSCVIINNSQWLVRLSFFLSPWYILIMILKLVSVRLTPKLTRHQA